MGRSPAITVAQLRAFVTAARRGSFAAAGVELALAQASVSESVRRLEDDYGLTLFLRGSRRLTLTSAGQQLLAIADRAVATFDSADASLRSFAALTGGVATFGLLGTAEYYLLADLARTFLQRHPGVHIRLVGQNSVGVAAAVAKGEVEAGIIVMPVDTGDLDVRPLLRDEVMMVTATRSRYGQTVTARDLASAPLVLYDAHYGWADPTRRQLREWVTAEGLRMTPRVEVEHVASALRLAEHGVGDTFVSRTLTQAPNFPRGLDLVPFSPPIYDTLVSVTRDTGALSPASLELLLLAEDMVRAKAVPGSTP